MSVIKNIIQTLFTSNGSEKVAADTDKITKAQTRLGQSSAGAGRQFAAQSNGLGGLVAAYAGAAATVFALQAAFEALARAAQSDTIIKGTSSLAAMTSQSGPRIIKTIQEITQGQLTMTEAAQNANIALSAGFNSSQIESFVEVAQKASRALGRDFTDSLQRIVRGVSKLEPELLDELGIFTRIEPAVQRYARQLGVAAGSLNEFQRRQAFATATIEEGTRKFNAIDTTSDSLQKTLEQLRVKITELGTGFLQTVGKFLEPFASFLVGDLGNALLAFGLVLALVFGKTTEVINNFVDRTGNKFSGWAGSLADKAKFATGEIENLRNAISKPVSAEKGAGLSGIQTKARATQDPAQAKRFADALDLQRSAAALTASQLNKINIAYKEQVGLLRSLGQDTSQSFKNLEAAIARNDTTIKAAGGRITTFIGISNAMRAAVSGLTVAFGLLGSAINFIFGAVAVLQLAGTLFDVDLLGNLVGMFKDLSQASKDLANGITSIALASAGGGAAVTEALKNIGASDEQIANSANRLKELRDQVEVLAQPIQGVAGGRGMVRGAATQESRIEAITQAIKDRQDIIKGGVTSEYSLLGTNPEELEQARVDLILLNTILKALQNESEGAAAVVSQLARATGLAGDQVATILAPEIRNSTESLTLFGVVAQKVNGSFSLENATDQQLKMLEAVVLSRNGVNDLNNAIDAGNISVNSAGAAIAGLESQLLVLKATYSAVTEAANSPIEAAAAEATQKALNTEIDKLEDSLKTFRAVEQSLIAVEKTYKDITSTFSREIGLLDTAEVTGIVNSFGQIAITQQDIDKNQAAYLQNIIKSTKYAKDLVGSERELEAYIKANNLQNTDRKIIMATINREAENYDKATAAVQGKLIDITRQVYELADAYSTISEDVNKQLTTLEQEARLLQLQIKVDDLQVEQEAARAAANFKQQLLENQIQLIELKVDNKKLSPVEGAAEITSIKDQILQAQRAALDEQFAISNTILDAEQALLIEETEIKQANITAEADAQRAKITSDLQVLESAASIYSSIAAELETSLVDGGNAVGSSIVTAINNGIEAFVNSLGGLGSLLGLEAQVAAFTPVAATSTAVEGPVGRGGDSYTTGALGMSEASIELERSLTSARTAAGTAADAVTALEKAQLAASANSYLAERAAIESKRELNRQNYEQEIALLVQKGEISKEEAEKRLREAKEAGGGDTDRELTALEERLKALFNAIKGNIENTLMSLNNLVFYGEGSFNEIMSGFFKNLQQDFFKTTVAEPVSDFLTTSLFSALGVEGAALKKGTDGLSYQGNSLLVKVTNAFDFMNPASAVTNPEDPTGETKGILGGLFDQITSLFTNIFGQNGILSGLFKGLFGQGGILSGLFSGIGGIFSGIFSFFGAAQGGLVHLAAGGAAASASLNRDRVPAMLEPGEFVIRKQSAERIGMPALQAMNATGGAPSGGNVFVNVSNEGSPKQAEASAPKFDGEKYVIDIVMRDIANNGPIRRSLRGRGGL